MINPTYLPTVTLHIQITTMTKYIALYPY